MKPSAWWMNERAEGGLQVALDQVNEAGMRAGAWPGWDLDACDDLCMAVNQLWSTWAQVQPDQDTSRWPAWKLFKALLDELPPDDQGELLGRPSVEDLANFQPLILDHSVEEMSQAPLADISTDVTERAAQDHREFQENWAYWKRTGSRVSKVLKGLCRTVLVYRNNRAHGEKTRAGPDPARTERNRSVAAVIRPVVEDLIDFLLDHPSRKLAVYGTLRPGQANDSVLEVTGAWRPVTIQGDLFEADGLPAFRFHTGGNTVPAELLESEELPGAWQRLDEFEGGRYSRILGLYRADDALGVANVYVWREFNG